MIPAVFMSAVSLTYFFASPECMGLLWDLWNIPMEIYYPIAVAAGILFAACFLIVFLKKMVWRVSRMP